MAHPEPACPLPTPQGSPYLWNKFADGKFPYRNAELLRAVQGRTDEAVREFWRLLAICHTVMVQEKDRECAHLLFPAWGRCSGRGAPETLQPTPQGSLPWAWRVLRPCPKPHLFWA